MKDPSKYLLIDHMMKIKSLPETLILVLTTLNARQDIYYCVFIFFQYPINICVTVLVEEYPYNIRFLEPVKMRRSCLRVNL